MSLFPLIDDIDNPINKDEEIQDENNNLFNQENKSPKKETFITKILKEGKCEQCLKKDFKYTCPGCLLRTCSVECVKQHKAKLKCTGKRQVQQFLARPKLNEKALLEDYNYLNEVARLAENANRELFHKMSEVKDKEKSERSHIRLFIKKVKAFDIKISCLNRGMFKQVQNQSYWNNKLGKAFFTLGWEFHLPDKVEIVTHQNDSTQNLNQLILHNHILEHSKSNSNLSQILDDSKKLNYLIKRIDVPANQATYYSLDNTIPLIESLKHSQHYEYPVIIVINILPSDWKIIPLKDVEKANLEIKSNVEHEDADLLELEKELDISEMNKRYNIKREPWDLDRALE